MYSAETDHPSDGFRWDPPDEDDFRFLPHKMSNGGTLLVSRVPDQPWIRVSVTGGDEPLPAELDGMWTGYSSVLAALTEYYAKKGVSISVPSVTPKHHPNVLTW